MSTEEEAIELYEKILLRELRCFPNGFWQGSEGYEYAAILTRYLLEKTGTPPTLSTKRTFQKAKLSSILHLFNGSTYAVIDNAYPGVYKPWELVQTPVGYWTSPGWEERAAEATRWVLECKLGWPVDEIPGRLSYRALHRHDLGGMINHAFNENVFAAVDNAYPGRFKTWEFRKLKLEWTKGMAAEAVRWLVLEKLKITPEEAVGAITYEVMLEHNLISAYRVTGSSIRSLVVNAFPELAWRYRHLKAKAMGPAGYARYQGQRRAME